MTVTPEERAVRPGLPMGLARWVFSGGGDSGNDCEMLIGETLGVVVGNHSAERKRLEGLAQIYFATAPHAAGILEGIKHDGFAEDARFAQGLSSR